MVSATVPAPVQAPIFSGLRPLQKIHGKTIGVQWYRHVVIITSLNYIISYVVYDILCTYSIDTSYQMYLSGQTPSVVGFFSAMNIVRCFCWAFFFLHNWYHNGEQSIYEWRTNPYMSGGQIHIWVADKITYYPQWTWPKWVVPYRLWRFVCVKIGYR